MRTHRCWAPYRSVTSETASPMDARSIYVLILLAAATKVAPPLQAVEALSPDVQSDGRIIFRFVWPGEARVELIGREPGKAHDFPRDSYDLKRNADGIWEVTVGPLLPGLYLYRFRVDGVECIDP